MYGSDIEAVRQYLDELGAEAGAGGGGEEVVRRVLEKVECPL